MYKKLCILLIFSKLKLFNREVRGDYQRLAYIINDY